MRCESGRLPGPSSYFAERGAGASRALLPRDERRREALAGVLRALSERPRPSGSAGLARHLEPVRDEASPVLLPDEVARHLHRGLRFGALHEIAPASREDMPSTFGFAASLAAAALGARPGPALLLVSDRAGFGGVYGHGLNGLGLDPARLVLIEAQRDQDLLWALEAALKSKAAAAVVAALGSGLDLTASRRLHLAAAAGASFLALLRPPEAMPAPAALTRWCIAPAPAARDRFGTIARPRWQVALERCRNGRPGTWVMEWNHDAHRFDLAPPLADHALPPHAETHRSLLPSPLRGGGGGRKPEGDCPSLPRTAMA